MLDFGLFMLFSLLETFAMFFLAFRVFKIDLYVVEMIFASLIMGFISYVLRNEYGLTSSDVIIQYLLTFCFFWLLFRIQVFYAAIMTGLAYLSYMLIQSSFYLTMNLTGMNSPDFPFASLSVYALQVVSALSTMLIASYIHRRRKGFDFVPDKPNEKVSIQSRDIVIFVLSVPSVFIILLMLFLAQRFSQFFVLMPLAYGILLYGYLYLSYKKDQKDHELIG